MIIPFTRYTGNSQENGFVLKGIRKHNKTIHKKKAIRMNKVLILKNNSYAL